LLSVEWSEEAELRVNDVTSLHKPARSHTVTDLLQLFNAEFNRGGGASRGQTCYGCKLGGASEKKTTKLKNCHPMCAFFH